MVEVRRGPLPSGAGGLVFCDILSGIKFDSLSDIMSGISSDILSENRSGISFDALSDILFRHIF